MNFQQSQSPPEWWHFLHLGFNYKVPGGTVTIKLSQGIARTISFGSTTTNMWTWRKTMTWQTHQPTNKKSSSNLLQMTNHFSLETNQTKTCWARGKRVGLGGDSCSQKCTRAATGWGGVNPRFSPIWATATKPTRDIPVKSWLVHDGIPIFVAYYNPQIGCENSNPINKEAKSPILAIFIAFYLIFPYNTRAPKISGTPPNWWNPKPPSTSYQVTVAWSFQTATIESEQGTPTSLRNSHATAGVVWGVEVVRVLPGKDIEKKKILKGVSLEKFDGSFLLKASLTKKEQSLYKTKNGASDATKMKHCIFQP